MNPIGSGQLRRRPLTLQGFKASRETRALKAESWFLRFAILISSIGDQHTSDRSFRQCPIFGEELNRLLASAEVSASLATASPLIRGKLRPQ